MNIKNFLMIKKAIISVVFIFVIIGGLYFCFTYKKNSNNDLKKFSDLVSVDTNSQNSSAVSTILTGVIGSNKPFIGKVFFGSQEIEITRPSFSTSKLSPGYYNITVQDSAGNSYLTSPTSIQIFPGKNDLKINVFN